MRSLLYFSLTLVLLLPFAGTLHAQQKAEDVTDRFFEIYSSKGSDEAVDYVFATNKWLTQEKATVDALKVQLKKGIAIIGQYYGYELIDKKVFGESYVMLSYMLRYDRQPVKFVFILYKPNDKWQIQNLKLDDRLDDDIEGIKQE